jgi:hypothetical protein
LDGELGFGARQGRRNIPKIFERGAEMRQGRQVRRSIKSMETGGKPVRHCRFWEPAA